MTIFKIKFFGSTEERKQIKLIKMDIDCDTRDLIEEKLKLKYKYKIIQGLKISEIKDSQQEKKIKTSFLDNLI